MKELLSEAMANAYPDAFASAGRVAEGLRTLADESRSLLAVSRETGARVLAVTCTCVAQGGAGPAVVVAIDAPVMRIRPAGTVSRRGATSIDAVLDKVHEETWRRSEVDVTVIGVPPPIEQVAPGDRAHCGAGPATYGVPVSTQNCDRAILTAGHAAPTAGVLAYDCQAQLVGEVESTRHSGQVPPRQETSDVAVIALETSEPDTVRATPPARDVAVAYRFDQVTAYGAVTMGRTANLLTAGNPFVNRPDGGDWGEAALTTYPISAPGDSGAPVFNQANELVGVIVGGYPGVFSVIQDITYQLQEAGASLR